MKVDTRRTKCIPALTQGAQEQLATFGENLLVAIKRRGLRRRDVAEQALISEPTLRAILRGDPRVGMGCYLAVLSVLGLEMDLSNLASPQTDEVGQALSIRNLPKRVRKEKSKFDF